MRSSKRSAPDAQSPRKTALDLLARREHSREELRQKLESRGFDAGEIALVLDDLEAERLLSDVRFTESYVRSRHARGFGPVRIRMELKARGVSDSSIDEHLDERSDCWREALRAQYRKRYGDKPVGDYAERARRGRFLQQRGFSAELIGRLLKELTKPPS